MFDGFIDLPEAFQKKKIKSNITCVLYGVNNVCDIMTEKSFKNISLILKK